MGAKDAVRISTVVRTKIPAVPRDAQRYHLLADFAGNSGYPQVTGPAVHSWVKRGVLPEAVPIHRDWAVKVFAEPVAVGRQLLALCHYRFDEKTRSIAIVGGLLWMDGFAVRVDTVREALTTVSQMPVALIERVTRQRFDVDSAQAEESIVATANALVYRHHIAERFGFPVRAGLADGIAEFLRLLFGRVDAQDADLDALDEIARLAHLDRGRRDRIPGVVEPWLPERPAISLTRIASAISPGISARRIAGATADELDSARRSGGQMAAAFAAFADLAIEAGRPGFAGLGSQLPGLSPAGARLLACLASLSFSSEARQLVANLPPTNHSG